MCGKIALVSQEKTTEILFVFYFQSDCNNKQINPNANVVLRLPCSSDDNSEIWKLCINIFIIIIMYIKGQN